MRRRDEVDEIEEVVEVDEKTEKKQIQKEKVEKRRNAKKRDRVARWSGVILLGVVMFVGFLLWVFGEMSGGVGY